MANIKNCSSVILLMIFILFIHLHAHFAKPTKQQHSRCIERERKALMEFKGSLIDDNNILSSWRGRDCCSWHGITCHNLTGFVQSLDLSFQDLTSSSSLVGEINSSLVNLEHLESLDLSLLDVNLEYLGEEITYLGHSTTGFKVLSIPAFLGSLRNLQFLRLDYAGFRGEIPQQLGNLSNLQHLSLGAGYNLSSKSLNWITRLSSLKSLEFNFVNLSECVDWLDSVNMLSSLSSLTLTHCGLNMPSNSYSYHVNNLTSLISLDLSGNYNVDFDTLPSWLFNLTRLEHLTLYNTGLRGPIPSMFAKMTTLTILRISGNSLSSSFPNSVCNLTALNYMDLSESDLQGSLPVCLGNLTSLTTLNLVGNKLSGEIPGELGYLTKLSQLHLSYNLFNSSIPSTFGQLRELVDLDLSENKLSGTVPSTLGKLTKLQTLDVSTNSLVGELSETFFKELKSLTSLYISKNKFLVLNVNSQWIPPFQIHSLYMGDVFIGTKFPSWLQTQTNLTELFLSNASISSDIPDWCHPNLQYFDLSNNFLNGSVPTFENASLQFLILSDNNISGNIPEELCNLDSLVTLSLANNQLSGRIPLCLGNLGELQQLYLENNNLYGHIPNQLGYLKDLEILHLNGNKFFGELPSSLQNMTSLKTLDLGNNELNGVIPAWIGKELSNLQYLRLQSNHFSGHITVNLCQLQALQILNLAQNNLVGTIPPCLGNLSMMSSKETRMRGYPSNAIGDAICADKLLNIIKGNELEYTSTLMFAKFISLSRNHLHGEIPDELMDLKGLQSLDLSNNDLSGRIPRKIGNLKNLESLDLSMNRISGTIPQSLADIDNLSYFNLSFNNLTGRIPTGNHFDTLEYNSSVYEGNSGLCGKLLMRSCPGDLVTSNKQNGSVSDGDNNEFEFSWFYSGLGTGFAIGFLGVMCIFYFNKSWRSAYFDFLENVYNRVWVALAIKISIFKRKFN